MQWQKEYFSGVNFPPRQARHAEGAHELNNAREASHDWMVILRGGRCCGTHRQKVSWGLSAWSPTGGT